jgi:hypothetical protein
MNDTRDSARQLAICQSTLIRAHGRVRVYLWRHWDWPERHRQARFLPWVLTTLWEGMRQFPNQTALAGYLQREGREFCQDALNESRIALRFLGLAGIGLVLVAALAVAIAWLNLEPFSEVASAFWAGDIVGAPLWILFFSLELVEFRTARYLSAALETAIERLEGGEDGRRGEGKIPS